MTHALLSAVALRLRSAIDPAVHVGTTLDFDYSTLVSESVPAVWVGALQLSQIGETDGYTGLMRQKMAVSWAVRVVAGRAAQDTSAEPQLVSLCEAIDSEILGWYPLDCDLPAHSGGFFDEAPGHSSVSRVLQYRSQTTITVPG